MKIILLLALVFLDLSVASAAPVTASMVYQCPSAADLKNFVANPDSDTVFVNYGSNSPMYKLVESASDINFFGAYIDNGIMKCSYSSTNRLLILEIRPELANAAFVNQTPATSVIGITPCHTKVPDQCKFEVKQ